MPLFIGFGTESAAKCRSSSAGELCNGCWPRQTEQKRPTNAQLFLIGNSAPMADLHSGARTSLNPWPCQTEPWGKVEGAREKNKREERAGVKRGRREKWEEGGREGGRKKEKREKEGTKERFFFPIHLVMMYSAGIGPTCMFNDRVCQRARSLCEPANVSTAPECSCAHLAWKKRGENNS